MITLDKITFERRGGYGCSNSDYEIQETTCCKRPVVLDNELNDIYFDPQDLNKATRIWEHGDSPCPLCGATKWNIQELPDYSQIPEEWKWAANAK